MTPVENAVKARGAMQIGMIMLAAILLVVAFALGKTVFVIAWTVGFSLVFAAAGLWVARRVTRRRS